ncbi:DNA methyltransferase [Erwinia aphidicola]
MNNTVLKWVGSKVKVMAELKNTFPLAIAWSSLLRVPAR